MPWASRTTSRPRRAAGTAASSTTSRSRARAREEPARAAAQDRRAQQPRPHDLAPARRRAQAPLPRASTSARQGRRAGRAWPRSSTTPTARRTSRSCTTPTARSATSSRRPGWRSDQRVHVGRGLRAAPRQRDAPGGHPARPRDPQHRAAPGQGRADLPLGRLRRPAHRARGRLRGRAALLGRAAQVHVRCRATIGRVGNPTTRTSSSARPAASATWGADPRCAARP